MKYMAIVVSIAVLAILAACNSGSGDSGSSSTGASGGNSNVVIAVNEGTASSIGVLISNGATAGGGRDFGSQDIASGATTALSIVVSNFGTGALTMQAPVLGGADAGEFALNTGGFSTTVAASGSTEFQITFDPNTAGTKNATVSLVHDSGVTTSPFVFSITGAGTSTTTPPVTPDVSVSGPTSILEGNTGTKNATFTVSLSQATSLTVSIDYSTQVGASNPATSGADYQAANGILTFTTGQTSKTVNVQINGDTAQESNETFDFTISNPSNANIVTATKTCTITDDDTPSSTGGRVVMAYAENLYGAGGSTAIQTFDYSAITHVIHGFVLPDANGGISEHSNFNAFRTGGGWMPQTLPGAVHAAGKKIVFSVGGAAPATNRTNFVAIASSATKRATFINNVVSSIQSWGYDGVDIDYEWPESTLEGQQFTTLMQELYTAVKAANTNYIVMFGAGPGDRMGWKEWSQLGNYCDYCFFFGYDWHWGLSAPTPVGPIKRPGQTWNGQNGTSFEASVRGAANYVIGQGFPASKLVIGLPYYNDSNQSWSGSPSSRTSWLTMTQAQRDAAIDVNFMEALINGHYVTTPESIALKMSALLDSNDTVLRDASNNKVTAAGVGWWEWGKEKPAEGELTAAVKAWLAAHP